MMRADGASDGVAGAASAPIDALGCADSSAARRATLDQRAGAAATALRRIVAHAAARYRPAGRGPYYFARGKLGGDPVFAALLRDGRISDAARIVDIGCGLGVLAAWLAAAEHCHSHSASEWPPTWPPPPKHWSLRGFDLRAGAVAAGQHALSDLGDRVSLTAGDARGATLPKCDVVVMLDVLHYLDSATQRTLLADAYEVLAPGGTLLLRIGDTASGGRARITSLVDWWVTLLRDHRWPRFHCRSLAEWKSLLAAIGFVAASQPMSEGTPFANVLLIATKER